ncbi:MAG: cytochrome C oxidase subunit IV family protein [Opitutales bacterium]
MTALVDTHHEEEQKRYHTFINLGFAMAVLTSVELVLILLPFSSVFILTSLILLSVAKFVGVVLWFMHMIYDRSLIAVLFCFGLILALGTVAALLLLFSPDLADPDAYGQALPELRAFLRV